MALADRFEALANRRCIDEEEREELAKVREELAKVFADQQLLAESLGITYARRGWLRRAIREAKPQAVPALLQLVRRELRDSAGQWQPLAAYRAG